MAIGFQRKGMFGGMQRRPWDTPGIGDGINERVFGQSPDYQPMGDPSAMPIGVDQMTKKPGFFQRPGVKTAAGILGDTLLTLGGGKPMYAPMMQERKLQEEDARLRAQMAQQQRMQRREDMQWEWQNKPKEERSPYRWESNDGSQWEQGPDGQPRLIYKDPTPKTTYISVDNANGTKTIVPVVNGQIMDGSPQGLIPIGGTLPPKGGAGSNVSSGFRGGL